MTEPKNDEPVPAVAEPDFDRYRFAVRRHAGAIALFAVGSGVLGALVLGSPSVESSQTLDVVENVEMLASVDLDESLEELITAPRVIQFFEDESLQEAVVGPDLDVSAAADAASGSVVVTVSGDDADEVESAADALFVSFEEFVGVRRMEATAELADLIQQQAAELDARLDRLDAELAGLGPDAVLRDAYLYERERLIGDKLYLQSQQRALQQFAASPRRVDLVSSSVDDVDARLAWFLTGFVLGATLAMAAVLIRAHFDQRVRLRTEVQQATGAGQVLTVPAQDAAGHDTAVAALRSALMRQSGVVALVPVGDRRAADLATQFSGENTLIVEQDALDDVAMDRAVIVACYGVTKTADLVQTSLLLTARGCSPTVAVLGEIPARELSRSLN